MTALYIALFVLFLLFLLLMLRIKVYFLYYGGKPGVEIGALFFRYSAPLEGVKDAKPKEEKAKKQNKKEAKEEKTADISKKDTVKEALPIVKDAVFDFANKFKKYAMLEKYKLKISLATGDPEKTALTYGALSGVVCSLHELALSAKKPPFKRVEVLTEYKPDFYGAKPDIAVELGFSLRVWHIFAYLISALRYYGKFKRLPKRLAEKTKGGNT